MLNILKKAETKEETYNPQSLKTVEADKPYPQYYKNPVLSSQYHSQQPNHESQIERQFLRSDQLQQAHHYIEGKEHSEPIAQSISISQNWKAAELMEYSRFKKREDYAANEINELRKTLKTILKSNQEYRKTLLAFQQEKTQLQLENVILVKKLNLLEGERETWQIKREHYQDKQLGLRNKGEAYKQLYAKNAKRLQAEVYNLNGELQQKNKRLGQLQTYNKNLFQHLAKEKQTSKIQLQKLKEQRSQLHARLQSQDQQISTLNAQLQHHKAKEIILDEDIKVSKRNETQLLSNIQHLQRSRQELKTKLCVSQRQDLQYYHGRMISDLEFSSDVALLNGQLAFLNGQLAQQKELNLLKSNQVANYQTQLLTLSKQITSLKHTYLQFQQLQQFNANLQLALAETERQNRQLEYQIRQEQDKGKSLELQLRRTQQEFDERCRQLMDSRELVEAQKMQAANKLQRITSDLLHQRNTNHQLTARSQRLEQQIEESRAELQLQFNQKQSKQQLIEQLLLKIKQHEVHRIQSAAKMLQQQFMAKKTQLKYEQVIKKQYMAECGSQMVQLRSELSDEKIRHEKQLQSLSELLKDASFEEDTLIIQKGLDGYQQQSVGKKLKNETPTLSEQRILQKEQTSRAEAAQPKGSGAANLKKLIVELKTKNQWMQAANLKLQSQERKLLLQCQNLQHSLAQSQKHIYQITYQSQQHQLACSARILNMDAELMELRLHNHQLRDGYLNLEKELKRCKLAMEEQLQLYAKDRNHKIMENVQILSEEIAKAQKVLCELSHPSPNGLKKFVNLMNATHRPNLSRQVQKIAEYYCAIQEAKTAVRKHYNNMKIIVSSILPLSQSRSNRTSPKKHDR